MANQIIDNAAVCDSAGTVSADGVFVTEITITQEGSPDATNTQIGHNNVTGSIFDRQLSANEYVIIRPRTVLRDLAVDAIQNNTTIRFFFGRP